MAVIKNYAAIKHILLTDSAYANLCEPPLWLSQLLLSSETGEVRRGRVRTEKRREREGRGDRERVSEFPARLELTRARSNKGSSNDMGLVHSRRH